MVDKTHDAKTLEEQSLTESEKQRLEEASRASFDESEAQANETQGKATQENVAKDEVEAEANGAEAYESEKSTNHRISPVKLEDELKQSFIDYAMSVIVDRALPDVRDGLKPVHRRVLFDMYDLKIWHNVPTKKSARVVGDVIGRFHPHGDAAVYETIVRMAQWFSMREPLIFGQGNFGNLDGDGAAAMRYTEVRMTRMAEMMLQDLDKETVNTYPNYDGNEQIPEVLPTRFPNLLVNGSSGIAVGLATNIPPHNLGEVIDSTIAMLDNPDITLDELMKIMPGPDFPTGGLIISSPDIKKAYETGRGRCIMRARTHIETDKQGRSTIYVDEIPYMVNKSTIVREIADLIRDKKIEGISEVNDLSDKDNAVRIAIDLKRDAFEEAVLNNLFQHTQMQTSFSYNVIALVNNRPKQLSLIEILKEFIKFRREVVTRRTVYLLRQDRRKAFLNEGLLVAKSNIQRIIDMITSAANAEEARNKLMNEAWDGTLVSSIIEYDHNGENICLPVGIDKSRGLIDGKYHLSDAQVRAILALQLNRLTHLATEEIQNDYNSLKVNIHNYLEILNDSERMRQVIREELTEVRDTFSNPRRSTFAVVEGYISKADLIARQHVLITLSHEGYIKYQDLSQYMAQGRGSKGNNGAKLKDEDYIVTSTVCNTHDLVLCFTNKGRCFVTYVYNLPTSNNRSWRGRPIQNFFDLQEGELVKRLLPLNEEMQNNLEHFIVFATARGGVKRIALKEFKTAIARANSNGIKAINIEDGDALVAVELTSGEDDIMLFSSNGRCIRFCEFSNKTAANDDESESDNESMADTEVDSDANESNDSDEESEISETERINAELTNFRRYSQIRTNGAGLRSRGRASGTVRGIRLIGENTVIAGMIVVPSKDIENTALNYLMITDKGEGKRGRLISIPGKLSRGGQGVNCCSKVARNENTVSVISVHEDSDYLVFSNTGTIMRSRVSAITARSRGSGFLRLKSLYEGESIVGLQEISPEIVAEIDEIASARAEEKRRVEENKLGVDESQISSADDLNFDDGSEAASNNTEQANDTSDSNI